MTDQLDLSTAFDELNAVVSDLLRRGRKPLIQGVKPALQVRTGRSFDERALGFATFLDFVRAAEQAGVVTVRQVSSGRWIDPVRRAIESSPQNPRIRADLWVAFNDWSGRKRYTWDADRQFVEVQPADEGAAAPAPRPGTRLIPIVPIAEETQLQWARDFLAGHPNERIAESVQPTLETGKGSFVRFALLIRADSRVAAEWRAARKARVAEAIRSWAARHALDVDPYSPVESRSIETAHHEASPDEPVDQLRAAIKRAVDRMSPSELRELRIPVGSLEGSGI
jgi:hypothetical protein